MFLRDIAKTQSVESNSWSPIRPGPRVTGTATKNLTQRTGFWLCPAETTKKAPAQPRSAPCRNHNRHYPRFWPPRFSGWPAVANRCIPCEFVSAYHGSMKKQIALILMLGTLWVSGCGGNKEPAGGPTIEPPTIDADQTANVHKNESAAREAVVDWDF